MRFKNWLITMSCFILAPMAMAGELDDVLKNYWETIGGIDAHKAIKTMTIKGSVAVSTPGGQMELGINIKMKDGDKARFDTNFQGMAIVQCLNGDTGWKINPMMGTTGAEEMTEDEMKAMKKQADFMGDFYQPEKKGIKLELKGKADVEGTEAYHITSTDKDGEVTQFYIDTENYVLIKETGTQNQNGMEFEADTYYSDYKEVGNIIMPHAMTIKSSNPQMGGGAVEMRFEEVKINTEVDDSSFAKPEDEAKAP